MTANRPDRRPFSSIAIAGKNCDMLRIGLLGAGRIGITHAKTVQALPDAKIAKLFDPADAAAEKAVS